MPEPPGEDFVPGGPELLERPIGVEAGGDGGDHA